jgi:hypothetical protein
MLVRKSQTIGIDRGYSSQMAQSDLSVAEKSAVHHVTPTASGCQWPIRSSVESIVASGPLAKHAAGAKWPSLEK